MVMADASFEVGGDKRQAHVLALPFPFQGHINPLLELSRKLAANGVTVSFINIPHYHSRIAPSLQPLLHRSHLPLRLLSLSNAYPPPPDLRIRGSMDLCLEHISSFMSEEVENVLHSLMKQAPSLPVTCLLADVRIPFAQCLADKFAIARIAFWPQSAASFSYHTALAHGACLPTDELAIVDFIPGVPAHTMSKAPVIFRPEIVGEFIFNFIMKPFLQLNGAVAVVINTFESLEEQAVNALRGQGLNVLCTGPLLPLAYFCNSASASPLAALTEENRGKTGEENRGGTEDQNRGGTEDLCLKWLDTRKPLSVLYISFGTLVCLEEAKFEELALGIEASGRSFLWSMRPDMVAGDWSSFVEAFKQRTGDRGLVVPWAPQLQVLSHPSIAGFLTHCGWNSAMESMCRGVPMIGLPVFGEQKLNLMCLAECWEVCLAMEMKGKLLQREQVEKGVCALLEGSEAEKLRRRAEKVRDAAACAVAVNGSSFVNFKRVLDLLFMQKQ